MTFQYVSTHNFAAVITHYLTQSPIMLQFYGGVEQASTFCSFCFFIQTTDLLHLLELSPTSPKEGLIVL